MVLGSEKLAGKSVTETHSYSKKKCLNIFICESIFLQVDKLENGINILKILQVD